MRGIIMSVALLVMTTPAIAAMDIKPDHYSFFADAIRVSGYTCKSSTGGLALGTAYIGGQLFKVYCNDNALVYRVVTGGNVLCVEPWDDPRKKCR